MIHKVEECGHAPTAPDQLPPPLPFLLPRRPICPRLSCTFAADNPEVCDAWIMKRAFHMFFLFFFSEGARATARIFLFLATRVFIIPRLGVFWGKKSSEAAAAAAVTLLGENLFRRSSSQPSSLFLFLLLLLLSVSVCGLFNLVWALLSRYLQFSEWMILR